MRRIAVVLIFCLVNQATLAQAVTFNPQPVGPMMAMPRAETTRYIGSLYEEKNPGTPQAERIQHIYLGDKRIASVINGQVQYYRTDHLGNVTDVVDAQGNVLEHFEYDPFGQITRHNIYPPATQTKTEYRYNGKPQDERTGLYYYGARYYNPVLGKFITPDTMVPGVANPQALNRYSYSLNDPINRVDPSGHWSFKKMWKDFVSAVRNPFDFSGQWNSFMSQASDPDIAPITSAVITVASVVFMQPQLFLTNSMWVSAAASAGSTAFLQSSAGQNLTAWTASNIYDNVLGVRPSTARVLASIDLGMTSSFMIERSIANIIADPANARSASLTDEEIVKLRQSYYAGDEVTFGPSLRSKDASFDVTRGLMKDNKLVGSFQKRTLDVPGLRQLGAQHSSSNVLSISGPNLNPEGYAIWGVCHQSANVTLLQSGISSTVLNLGSSWDMFVTTAVYGNYGGQLGNRIFSGIKGSTEDN